MSDLEDAHKKERHLLIDYIAEQNSIDETFAGALLEIPKFRAAVVAFAHNLVPLGYAALFTWDDAKATFPILTPERLLGAIRYVTHRYRLRPPDDRRISIDYEQARASFPSIFGGQDRTLRKALHDGFIAQMGSFLSAHPWRAIYQPFVQSHEEAEYTDYWLKNSPEHIHALLADRRFLAGLDGFRQDIVSYGGLLEKLYGDGGYVLVSELGWHLFGLVLVQLAKMADRGEIIFPEGLQAEFPQAYQFYNPEAFGRDR